LNRRRKPRKPATPIPKRAIEAGSGVALAEKFPETLEVNAAKANSAVTDAEGDTFVNDSERARV
jgi:hypothetical protein